MPLDVLFLVLFGAALHATWNAIVKAGTDKSLDAAMVALGAGAVGLFFLPFVPLPKPEAWPFILVSAFLQFAYFQLVAGAYRAGDIGLVYPLMRGTAPLLVAMTSGVVLGEHLTPAAMAGVLVISAGVLTLAFESRRGGRHAILLALANAVVIATYTFVEKTVVKGPQAHPFYRWAAAQKPAETPRWNFHKYLIGHGGELIGGYPAGTDPLSPQLVQAIGRELQAG